MNTTTPITSIEDHLDWVANIARSTARRYHLSGLDSLGDLVSAGTLKALTLLQRFAPKTGCTDPVGAFRGYAFRSVKTECQREAERLINGGTYHARRRTPGVAPVIVANVSALTAVGEGDADFEPNIQQQTRNFRAELRHATGRPSRARRAAG